MPPTMIGWVIFALSMLGISYDVVFLRRVSFTNLAGAFLLNLMFPLRFAIAGTHCPGCC
jgi:hypothetical protein